uniref:Chemokine interleukin-8-like domain-containing protein n=1 Tax=Mola mola TaxID=94237 RepID=A0A3Q3WWC8_MOLML
MLGGPPVGAGGHSEHHAISLRKVGVLIGTYGYTLHIKNIFAHLNTSVALKTTSSALLFTAVHPQTAVCLTCWGTNCFCPHYSTTMVRITRIVNYTIQSEGICPIKAIMFHTKSEKTICSDPNGAWAKHVIGKLEEEKNKRELQERAQTEGATTCDITSTMVIKPKKAPQKKGRNGWRRPKKKSKRRKR